MTAHWLGLIPSEDQSQLRARIDVTETLAVIISAAVQKGSTEVIPVTIKAVVERIQNVQSVLLRKENGSIIFNYGDHPVESIDIDSTPVLMKAPIFIEKEVWGVVEVGFTPLHTSYLWGLVDAKFLRLIIFITVFGLIIYLILVSKVLRYLDPYRTIPARVRRALNALTDGVVLMDRDENIVLTNEAFEEKIKQKSQQLMGKEISSLPWTFPERTKEEKRELPWREALQKTNTKSHVTLQYKINDEDKLTLIVNCTPIQDGFDKVRGILCTFSDVTEFELMNQELESMARFLRHEAGNALLGASSTINILEESGNLSEEDKQLLHRAQRSHRIIQRLLDSIREAKNIKTTFEKETTEPIRLDLLMAELVKGYAGLYKDRQFLFKSDGRAMTVLGQEERITQMLDKLASNAVEHAEKDTSIVIECEQQEDQAVIKVINQGETLPEDKQKIFDLFASFRNKATSRHNQGIGLYVVKLIAEMYGGSVEARDRKDVTGAEFVIRLPMV